MSITGTNNPFSCDPVIFTATNSIVTLGTITRVGNNFTFSVGFVWKINGTIYQNTAPITLTVSEADAGFNRIDNAILNTSNSIELQQGLPSDIIALQPLEPENAILLTSWDISGESVSEGTPPIVGTNYLQKEFEKSQIVNATGSDVVIALNIKGRNNIILNGALTGVIGFSLTNLELNPAYAEYPHEGKDYFIQNKTGHSVTLKNGDSTVDISFFSKDGNDIVVPNNGIVFFKKYLNILQEIFRSFQTLQSVTDEGNTTTNSITVSQIDLLEPEGTYTSTIKSQGLTEDRELLAPDSSGTIATEDYVNTLINDGIETKQDKIFKLIDVTAPTYVTGTLSETQVFRGVIPPNTYNVGANPEGGFLNLNALFSRSVQGAIYTIRVKLSTSPTMPGGTTGLIATYSVPATILTAQFIRTFSIINNLFTLDIEGFPPSTSALNDFTGTSGLILQTYFNHSSTNYLYVSIQLSNTSDNISMRSFKANNL